MDELHRKLIELGIEIKQGAIDRGEYYSVKEAAEILGVTTKTIRNRIEKKELLAVFHDIGVGQSQYLIPKSAVNMAVSTMEVVPLSRAVSVSEIVQAVKAQMMEENASLRSEMAEIKASQERIEESLAERDKRLLEVIRAIQERDEKEKKPFWKFWA